MEQAFLDLIQQVVSPTSPLLGTGGEVHIVDATAERRVLASILAFHNPGGGNNPQSPEAAIRRHLRRIGFANISGAANGHIHVGPIAGEDLTVSRRAEIVNGQRVYPERRVFTIIPGSTKGTTETPDLFLQQKGVALGQMPGNTKNHGGGVIFRHAQGEYRGYPVAGIGPAETMYLAIRAWELAQGKNVLSELMGSLAATGKDIDLTDFDAIPQAEGATHEGHIPMSNDVTYAQTDKPRATALHFIANTRVGAGSFNEDALRAHIADIVRRPHANFIAMRGLVDSVANLPNREEVLLQLRGILGEGASRILGIMMNDVLLDARWQRELRIRRTSDDGERVVEEYPPIYPGDVLVGRENGDQVFGRNPLEGTPLLQSDTDMLVRLGTIDYLLTLRGETSHLKSVINPPHGLARLREVLQIESDVMAGGTPMESIAWRTQHTPTGVFHIVVPGGYSLFDSKGKSNKTLWPLGGQGVVLMSTEKTIFPFGTYADGADLHEAILLYEAIVRSVGKEGYEDFMKNLAGRRKKRAVTKTT